MRVEAEDSRKSAHYGEHGTVISIQEEGEEEEATVLTEDAMFRISVKCLAQRTEKELKKHKELRNFKATSEIDKQVLLMMSGFGWDPEREEPIDSVTAKEPECFENQQVKIWCGYIQWSLGAKSAVVYNPDYTQVLSGTVHGGVEPERLKSIQASFRAHLDRYERHIFPISSWKMSRLSIGPS